MERYKQGSNPRDTVHRATGSQDNQAFTVPLTGTVQVFL